MPYSKCYIKLQEFEGRHEILKIKCMPFEALPDLYTSDAPSFWQSPHGIICNFDKSGLLMEIPVGTVLSKHELQALVQYMRMAGERLYKINKGKRIKSIYI